MEMNLINPFVIAVESVLGQFGLSDIKKKGILSKEEMVAEKEVIAFIGLVGDIKGNVAYSYSVETAKQLASVMMMGMPVEDLDDMTKSALSELANMFAGNSTLVLEMQEVILDVTPPSLAIGENIYVILSFHEAVTVILETGVGEIEVNIGLEI